MMTSHVSFHYDVIIVKLHQELPIHSEAGHVTRGFLRWQLVIGKPIPDDCNYYIWK